ncbi:formate dehydrogenase accessory sulfurtransferase FdhD, partial [Promineifilum sp.]|uniref:formate dehydrogenase accessory sulfurtransferase FdhD n=1 Tax=Promineifilum sp. TaxID=2664178 RepID=UPI0035B194CD
GTINMKLSQFEPGEFGRGALPVHYLSLNGGAPQAVDGAVVEEALACITLNGEELATFMCTPRDLPEMALGFLYNEGVINGLDEVRACHVSKDRTCVDVWLHNMEYRPPRRAIITAGCGGGVTFDDLSEVYPPLQSDLTATPEELAAIMRQLHLGAALYQEARGIHTAVLADRERILLQVEDIGRHNCLDKLQGAALLAGVPTKDRVLLSSGRISSEMINKARRLETPIVCSRTSPTSLSVALAEAWNLTIVAYLRQDRMRVYTHPERVVSY